MTFGCQNCSIASRAQRAANQLDCTHCSDTHGSGDELGGVECGVVGDEVWVGLGAEVRWSGVGRGGARSRELRLWSDFSMKPPSDLRNRHKRTPHNTMDGAGRHGSQTSVHSPKFPTISKKGGTQKVIFSQCCMERGNHRKSTLWRVNGISSVDVSLKSTDERFRSNHGTPTTRRVHQEHLQTGASVRQVSCAVRDEVNDLLPDGVVSTCEMCRGDAARSKSSRSCQWFHFRPGFSRNEQLWLRWCTIMNVWTRWS